MPSSTALARKNGNDVVAAVSQNMRSIAAAILSL
ncbi:MAG: hypothetical protein BWY02_02990 [bacterium ADurb.Bin157]|nr:MAG: hypothetical protein BWY02_02990 [bacterium ADurb.Bin157]